MTRYQYIIPLKQDKPYKSQDSVYVLTKKELKDLLDESNEFKRIINSLNHENSQYKNQLDLLRNKYDHLQVRFNKCQEEQNKLEREMRLLIMETKKKNFFDRVLNRLPENLKELKEGREL
jgi:chromosome segregation ATPase